MPVTPSAASRFVLPVLILPVLILPVILGACAVLPESGPAVAPRPVAAYATEQSFSLPEGAWPGDGWWSAWGDPALDGLVAEALAGQPSLREAAARLARAEAEAQMAGAAQYPDLSVNAQLPWERQSQDYLMPAEATPKGWRSYPQATFNLSWDLDLWGRNRAALAAATSDAEAARADLAQARLELSSALAAAWAEMARLTALRDTAAAAVAVRAKTADLMERRRLNGLENEVAVQRAQSRLAAARGDLAAAEEQISLQRNAVAQLLGAGPDRGLALPRPRLDLARAPGLPPQLAFGLLGRRPDVVAARRRVEAAESGIDRAKAAFYPNVNLSAVIGLQSLGIENFAKHASLFGSIGPALSLPIFEGGRLRGELRGARADRDLAVAEYDRALTQALREVADAATGLKALGGRLAAAEQANAAAEAAWSRMRQRYEGGLATALDALTAEDEMLSSRRPLDELRSRAFVLDAQLARALGGGWQMAAE